MPPIINIYRDDPSNLGDTVCTPTRYFDWLRDATKLDVKLTDFSEQKSLLENSLVIVGGGGLVDHFEARMKEVYAADIGQLVLWGAGHNKHDATSISLSPDLERYNLVGLRDDRLPYEWVPCVSCLDAEFDRPAGRAEGIVLYEHHDFPLSIEGIPKLSNEESDLGTVINFMRNAEIVLTNTYHGTYWATLLGKRVIIIEPFSSKFYGLRHQHPMADRSNWQKQLERTAAYPEALAECRQANQAFASRVLALVQDGKKERLSQPSDSR